MTLKIIYAQNIVFEGTVEMVGLPGEMGRFTVLPHHASLVASLVAGEVVYSEGGERHQVEIEGGIVDVDNDVVSVCVC